jgi:hypothetical protein
MKCSGGGCGSYAINHHLHGRDGSDGHLCDVCFWRSRAINLLEALEALIPGAEAMGWNTDKALAAIAKTKGETQP